MLTATANADAASAPAVGPSGGHTLRSYLDWQRANTVSSGVDLLDSALGGGFHPGLYDLNCAPGSVGKWELIFCSLAHSDGDSLVIETDLAKVPWFKLRSLNMDPDRIHRVIVSNLAELVVLLQSDHMSQYTMVIIDGFHELIRRSCDRRYEICMQQLSLHLNGLATKFGIIFITIGHLDLFIQGTTPTGNDPNSSGGTKDYLRVLVPQLSLKDANSRVYANRIILYNDWMDGLDRTKGINQYIRLLMANKLDVCPHFLCVSVNRGTGFFKISSDFTVLGGQNEVADSQN